MRTILILLLSAIPAFCEMSVMLTGGTNNVSATTTNTYTQPAFFSRTGNLGIGMHLKLDGAGTTAVVLRLDRSVDGTNWVTGGAVNRYVLTPAGTTTVGLVTNVTVGGVRFWRPGTLENDNATAITNLIIKLSD